jgi:peptidoglycan/xylan/chitin deacetylase (PgdA/CDA1 family)/GT2 family glycosyltransferase/fucose 4-O-acetylase-like acetyltransferase
MAAPTRWRRPRLRLAWVLAVIMGGLLAVMLVIAGFASSRVGNDAKQHTPGSTSEVPDSVRNGGAVVDTTGSRVASLGPPAATIALTFDDGPDPTWTPQILAILRQDHVPATFFVVGSPASQHPELLRAIHAAGSEIGLHTFTHPDLVNVSQWRLARELDETELALAGATGVTTDLFRPPYSAGVSSIDDLSYQVVRAAGARGYLSVFTNVDSADWTRPGVNAIVRNADAEHSQGAVVLMHDAGGDRSQTVAALAKLIPLWRSQGYRFATVTDAVGLPPANQPAPVRDRVVGAVLLGAIGVSLGVVSVLRWVLLVVGVLVVLRLALMLRYARRHARRRRDPAARWDPPVTEPVSVIVPAHNEAANIEVALRSILASDHPVEVLVIDDGSTDGTADLVERLCLPGVRVIRKPNGGKASALNTGIAYARHELIVMVDGDTLFEPDTVGELVAPFADPEVGAVSGNVKIANRNTFLTRLQHIEYVIGFNVDRRVHDLTGSICTIPGAAGAFRRVALLQAGGLSDQTLAEDTDLTIAIGRAGWRMVFQERAIAWTEAPVTVRELWRQRYRWTFGTMQSVWKHRRAIFARGAAGRIGRFGLLHVIAFQIVLPATAPLIDVFLVYGLLFQDPGLTVGLWLAMLMVQSLGAMYAFHLDGEDKSALWLMPLQQVVYRQLMYVVLAQSIAAALSGIRVRWQRIGRLGALEAIATPPPAPTTAVPRHEPVAAGVHPQPTGGGRERWLDTLSAVALLGVVAYHLTGRGWLTLVFPFMGVLFALGGSLMLSSLGRAPAVDVIGRRIRRLLLPFWAFALVIVPLMLGHGWSHDTGDYTLNWPQLVFWAFPILDPSGSSWGADLTVELWFIRAYLWFVLLSPLLLTAFRRRPALTLLTPLALVAVDGLIGSPLSSSGLAAQGLLDFVTYATCWMLGFAHREGLLRRIPAARLAGLSGLAVGLGGWWTATHRSPDWTLDLNGIPVGQALISAGAVLLLLRFSPTMAWLDRIPVLGRLVTILNARAVSIFLWHSVAIGFATSIDPKFGWHSMGARAATTVALLVIAVLAFGWVEDLAARRPPRLIPGGRPTWPRDRGGPPRPEPAGVGC